MVWRIGEHVTRAVIDNRVRGKVTGTVWLAGRNEPLTLDLQGDAGPDLAGSVLTVENPAAKPAQLAELAAEQRGVCGELTGSRKFKIPNRSAPPSSTAGSVKPAACSWSNGVHLEWCSERNGRVVIELVGCPARLSAPLWRLALADEAEYPDEEGDTKIWERNERIEAMKDEVRELSGGKMIHGGDSNLPLDLQEQFWENVLEFERCPVRRIREVLAEDGVVATPPDRVAEEDLPEELSRLIAALAQRDIYLDQTNHLSDRALYALVVERLLEEETEALPPGTGWNHHFTVSDYGADDDESGVQLYLRYYADESMREEWAHSFPEDPIPPHEDPPYDRDRHLPRPPGPGFA